MPVIDITRLLIDDSVFIKICQLLNFEYILKYKYIFRIQRKCMPNNCRVRNL